MKPIVLLVMLLLALPAAATDAGSCYTVADADARAYCLAKAHRDPGRCYAIQGSGLRSLCLAEVRE